MPNIVKQLNLIYEDGIIKCKGRLQNSDLAESAKTPIFMPNNSYIVKSLVPKKFFF